MKTQIIKKISYNNWPARLFYLSIGSLLLLILLYFGIAFLSENSSLSLLVIILYTLWMTLLISIIYLNCMDWDIYIGTRCFILKRLFKKVKIVDEKKFIIKSIPIISIFFGLYSFHTESGESYLFKHLPVRITFLASEDANAKKIQDEFLKIVESG